MQIKIWYGLEQRVGHLGEAQDDFNLLGEVVCPGEIADLRYILNEGPPVSLSVGNRPDGFGDGRRLARTGHFNADIPIITWLRYLLSCLNFPFNSFLLGMGKSGFANANTSIFSSTFLNSKVPRD